MSTRTDYLEQVRQAAIMHERTDRALRDSIKEAYDHKVPMTHIARAWGKTEGAVRMYLKRNYGSRR